MAPAAFLVDDSDLLDAPPPGSFEHDEPTVVTALPPRGPARTTLAPLEDSEIDLDDGPIPVEATEEVDDEPYLAAATPPPIVVPPPRGPTPLPAPPRNPVGTSSRSPDAYYSPPVVAAHPEDRVPGNLPRARLEVVSGPAKGTSAAIEASLTLGRGVHCELRIARDRQLSLVHCRVERRADGFFLVDKASSNGTVVNGAKVVERRLQGGETIMVGKSVLLFRIEDQVS
jgi:hypothetical protein